MKFLNMTFPIADRGLLMKWHEPNAYFRKNLTLVFFIKIYALIAISLLIISPRIIRNNPQHAIIAIVLLYFFLCTVFALSRWFASASSVVRVKKDVIIKTNSGRSYFNNIESCNVYIESYKDTKFFILKLTLEKKNEFSFLKPKQVSEVAVPENVDLEQVLQILRDKGSKLLKKHCLLNLAQKIKRAASNAVGATLLQLPRHSKPKLRRSGSRFRSYGA